MPRSSGASRGQRESANDGLAWGAKFHGTSGYGSSGARHELLRRNQCRYGPLLLPLRWPSAAALPPVRIRGIRDRGIEGATLLEVGCGPGYLRRALLGLGASRATGVNLSARMLETVRAGAKAEGLAKRTAYVQGDFVHMADEVPEADVVVLATQVRDGFAATSANPRSCLERRPC
jgi:2-polyprenyl-3-methyl-5-hydroxy-6-metoxy-1,4-benzoquinol methylase